MDDYRFSIVVHRNGNGWVAVCPEFEDCEARGETYEDALANIREAIREWLAAEAEEAKSFRVTEAEVTV